MTRAIVLTVAAFSLLGVARGQYGIDAPTWPQQTGITYAAAYPAAMQPPAEDYHARKHGYFYNCHIGSFAILGKDGRALFKIDMPLTTAVDAHLQFFAANQWWYWYRSLDNQWLFAFAKYPGCGGCHDCGHHSSHHGYPVWIYRRHGPHWHPVKYCCASRCVIYDLQQAGWSGAQEQLPNPMP